jgi:predicted TIM-barrel fold metal-dependent hydrolase
MSAPLDRREFLLGTLAMATAYPAPKYRIIDPHVHVWVNDPHFPWPKETTELPKQDATPAMLLELMKANGVPTTVIVQPIFYRWGNRYVADSVRKYEPYFQGVCRANPLDPAAPNHLSKLTEQGFRGVRLSPAANASGDWISGPLMPPLWKRAEALKVPMLILTSITRIPYVSRLIEKCPNVNVVIDHMADCPIDQPGELGKLLELARYPHVFVKISHAWAISRQPYPWLDAQEYVKRLYSAYGPKRLMWGTDWPLCEGTPCWCMRRCNSARASV